MTGIRLPKHLYRGRQYCEMQDRSIGAPTTNNLLQAHLIQMHEMQNQKKNRENNNYNSEYIDLGSLYEQPMKYDNDAKAQNANVVEIVPKAESKEEPAKVKEEQEMEETSREQTASASVHVVDELRKVLESRKRESESGTSRDKEEEMDVASSFSGQDKMDESVIEQRKQRRRERNRLAAQRCRLKKREQAISVNQEVNQLENANKELRHKIRRLQNERDTLHSLIRKHLPKCVSHPEIETSNMETDAADKAAFSETTKIEQRVNATLTPGKATATTWTISCPTETVNIVDSMDRNKASESSQIPQVKGEPTEDVAHRESAKGTAFTAASKLIWPALMPVQVQSAATNILPQTGSATIADVKSLLWPGMSAVPPVAQINLPTVQPVVSQHSADMSIPNLDQPLVIDLSADRFNRTASQKSNAPRPECTSPEATEGATKIIGHYIVR